jgi:hypothetical protein
MVDPAKLRKQAEECRSAARRTSNPSPYLLELARHYDERAAELETAHAGAKPNRPASEEQG